MAALLAEVVKRTVRLTMSERGGATFTVTRSSRYGTVPARLGVQVDTADTWVAYDYEMPLDVPVTYTATLDGGGTVKANSVVMPSGGQDWWVAVSQPSLTQPVTIESFPALQYALGHALVQPQMSRYPIAVIQARRSGRGVLTLLTLTLEEGDALLTLVDRSPFFYLTGPPDRGFTAGGLYLLAQDLERQRVTRVAQDPARRWVIQVAEVDRPPLAVALPESNTLGDWVVEGTDLAGWAGRTWLDVLTEEGVGP